jgi:hypothetical protein
MSIRTEPAFWGKAPSTKNTLQSAEGIDEPEGEFTALNDILFVHYFL